MKPHPQGPSRRHQHSIGALVRVAAFASLALLAASVATSFERILAYTSPTDSPTPTTQGGFLPAPNPATYCASPDYFGRWSLAQAVKDGTTPSPALVTTDNAFTHSDGSGPVAKWSTVRFSQDGFGAPFTPKVWEGNPNAPLGIVLSAGNGVPASGNVTFDQPLFFSQWVFPDTDLPAEGFDLKPAWATGNAGLKALALYGGDANTTATGRSWNLTADATTSNAVVTAGANTGGETLEGRVQADFLGPLNGFFVERVGTGNLGFIGGSGCAAIGLSKQASTPVWDPATKTFVVDYTVRVFNNMPTLDRIQTVVAAGQASSWQDANNLTQTQIDALSQLAETDLQISDPFDLSGFSSAVVSTPPASPDGATVNPAFDGVTDDLLLAGTDQLEQEGLRTVTFSVTYTPDFASEQWSDCATTLPNQAATSATLGDIAVEDLSDDGESPLPASENSAGGTDDPTVVEFAYECGVGLAKQIASGPTSNGDGTYALTYRFTAENTGTVPLYGIEIADDLSNAFGTALVGSVTDSDSCAALTDGLAPAATCEKVLTVTIKPTDGLGPWENSATVTAAAGDPTGLIVTDVSTDGADPDPDGDGDPTNNAAPTSTGLAAGVSLTKTATAGPTSNGDGTFDATYELTATNTGTAYLDTVVIDDDLAGSFGGAYVSGQVDSDTCSEAGLDVGASCSQIVSVTIRPGTIVNWQNNASVVGTAGGVTATADASADISITEAPAIGLAKKLTSAVSDGNGTYSVTYQLLVENLGDTSLTNIAVDDDLAAVFGPALINSGVTSNTCQGATLAAPKLGTGGTTCSLTIVAVVRPGSDLGPYDNTATVTGTSPAGTTVTDVSHDGAAVDPDGDGDATNNSDPTPVTFVENPEIGLAKTLAGPPVNNGDDTFAVTYELIAENTGDVSLSNVVVTDDTAAVFGAAYVSSAKLDRCAGVTLMPPDPVAGTPGDTCTAKITVIVKPGANLGPYDNTATVDARSPAGATVSDVSQDGTEVDPDGTGPGDNSDPTPVSFSERPVVGLAKHIIAGPKALGDGSYELTYELVAKNMGDVSLTDVTIDDDIAAAFAGARDFSQTVTADACAEAVLQPSFPPGDGDMCAITIDVAVTPGANLGPYENSAVVNATAPSGAVVSDTSQDNPPTMSNPDLDGDGDPSNDSDPTIVSFNEKPVLGLAKAAYNLRAVGGGQYAIDYRLMVANLGDVVLNDVVVVDNLDETFGDVTYVVSDVASTGATVNPTYTGAPGADGKIDTDDLLSGTDSFAVGKEAEISFTVTFTPAGEYGPYLNIATAAGTSPSGRQVGDDSFDGANPDPDGDGNAIDNMKPTRIAVPAIGITKSVVDSTPLGNGQHKVTYRLAVSNVGSVVVNDVQVIDDLADTFVNADAWSVETATSPELTINKGFNGASNTNLLAGTDSMRVGGVATIDLVVNVTASSYLGPFDNTAVATGVGPEQKLADGSIVAGVAVRDDSLDVIPTNRNPDGNGNGDPTDDRSPTSVAFSEAPQISLSKRVSSGPTINGTSYELSYELVATNTGDVPLTGVSVTDDLSKVFGPPAVVNVVSVSATAPATANPGYDGVGDIELLSSTLLTPGESTTITIRLLLGQVAGTSTVNSADASGTSPTGQLTSDRSQDGTVADTDANGDPSNDSDPTPAVFPTVPVPQVPDTGLAVGIPLGVLALGLIGLGVALVLLSRRDWGIDRGRY